MKYSDAYILFLMLGKVVPCWVMECVCMCMSMLQLEESKEVEEEEEEEEKRGRGRWGSWGWGQTEVKLLGAVQISHLHSGQEKTESVVSVMALLPGEKETDWRGR